MTYLNIEDEIMDEVDAEVAVDDEEDTTDAEAEDTDEVEEDEEGD